MYEMWKRKQIHENARKMFRTKILVKKFWENGQDNNWKAMILSEGRTDRERS